MNKQEQKFIQTVQEFYNASGRHNLPWRKTHNPYRILVSEIMLQQTQVVRVLPKYQAFIKRYPTVQALAEASLGEVLVAWQGLGYNRRAKLLYQSALYIIHECNGIWPKTYAELQLLSGVGPYTAGAIMAFAYNEAVPVLETNIRTVYLHHFFISENEVSDSAILTLVERTLDRDNPRQWYAALMDYGTYLKSVYGNNTKQSASYAVQSRFTGSNRQVRGMIVRTLSNVEKATKQQLSKHLPPTCTSVQLTEQLTALLKEKLIIQFGRIYQLPRIVESERNKNADGHTQGQDNKY